MHKIKNGGKIYLTQIFLEDRTLEQNYFFLPAVRQIDLASQNLLTTQYTDPNQNVGPLVSFKSNSSEEAHLRFYKWEMIYTLI